MKIEQILCLVIAELDRAAKIHPGWPADIVKAAAILAEEAGETLQAANTYDELKTGKNNIITEAVQTAAMAIRLLENIDQEGTENE